MMHSWYRAKKHIFIADKFNYNADEQYEAVFGHFCGAATAKPVLFAGMYVPQLGYCSVASAGLLLAYASWQGMDFSLSSPAWHM